jgi:hypothetical protein
VQLWQQISNSGLDGQAAVALQRLLFVVATAVGRQQGSEAAEKASEAAGEAYRKAAEMAERFADQVREAAAAKVALAEQAVARETHVAALKEELAMKDLALKEEQRATAVKLYMKDMGWLNMRGILGGFPHYDAGMHRFMHQVPVCDARLDAGLRVCRDGRSDDQGQVWHQGKEAFPAVGNVLRFGGPG